MASNNPYEDFARARKNLDLIQANIVMRQDYPAAAAFRDLRKWLEDTFPNSGLASKGIHPSEDPLRALLDQHEKGVATIWASYDLLQVLPPHSEERYKVEQQLGEVLQQLFPRANAEQQNAAVQSWLKTEPLKDAPAGGSLVLPLAIEVDVRQMLAQDPQAGPPTQEQLNTWYKNGYEAGLFYKKTGRGGPGPAAGAATSYKHGWATAVSNWEANGPEWQAQQKFTSDGRLMRTEKDFQAEFKLGYDEYVREAEFNNSPTRRMTTASDTYREGRRTAAKQFADGRDAGLGGERLVPAMPAYNAGHRVGTKERGLLVRTPGSPTIPPGTPQIVVDSPGLGEKLRALAGEDKPRFRVAQQPDGSTKGTPVNAAAQQHIGGEGYTSASYHPKTQPHPGHLLRNQVEEFMREVVGLKNDVLVRQYADDALALWHEGWWPFLLRDNFHPGNVIARIRQHWPALHALAQVGEHVAQEAAPPAEERELSEKGVKVFLQQQRDVPLSKHERKAIRQAARNLFENGGWDLLLRDKPEGWNTLPLIWATFTPAARKQLHMLGVVTVDPDRANWQLVQAIMQGDTRLALTEQELVRATDYLHLLRAEGNWACLAEENFAVGRNGWFLTQMRKKTRRAIYDVFKHELDEEAR